MTKYRLYAVEGDADGVVAQIRELFDAGLDGLIFNLHDSADSAAIAAAGALLTDAFGPAAPESRR